MFFANWGHSRGSLMAGTWFYVCTTDKRFKDISMNVLYLLSFYKDCITRFELETECPHNVGGAKTPRKGSFGKGTYKR